jgi:hypothetical protein
MRFICQTICLIFAVLSIISALRAIARIGISSSFVCSFPSVIPLRPLCSAMPSTFAHGRDQSPSRHRFSDSGSERSGHVDAFLNSTVYVRNPLFVPPDAGTRLSTSVAGLPRALASQAKRA